MARASARESSAAGPPADETSAACSAAEKAALTKAGPSQVVCPALRVSPQSQARTLAALHEVERQYSSSVPPRSRKRCS